MRMSVRLYLLRCDICGFRRFTDGSDLKDLIEVKTCRQCSGGRRFKCNKCGYLMKANKVNVPTKIDPSKDSSKKT